MTRVQRRIIGLILVLTVVVLLTFTVLALTTVGFSFGTFALYGLFPSLVVYFVGVALYLRAGKNPGITGRR